MKESLPHGQVNVVVVGVGVGVGVGGVADMAP